MGQDWLTQSQQPVAPATKPAFSFEQDTVPAKLVFTIYGKKGVGKTMTSITFPGTISALSFDKKTTLAKKQLTEADADNRVKVYDAIKYYTKDSGEVLNSAVKSLEWIKFLLEKIKTEDKPDWVLIDGIEVLNDIAEFVMRKENALKPYSGVANLTLWKIRKAITDKIHEMAFSAAKRGVIYTAYTALDELVEDGTLISKKESPKYIGNVMMQTDIVMKIESSFDVKNRQYKVMMTCESSKANSVIKTGTVLDITGKQASDFINFSAF